MSELETLFARGLRRLYAAHEQGARQAVANRETSTDPRLKRALVAGAEQNRIQARRLEEVFATVHHGPATTHDEAMQGIIDTNNLLISQTFGAGKRDLINIASGQTAAHFYLASYGTLRAYAEAMGNRRAAELLQETLDEPGGSTGSLPGWRRGSCERPGGGGETRSPALRVRR